MRAPESADCPRCGRSLSAAARFCGACGSPTDATSHTRIRTLNREDSLARAETSASMGVVAGTLGVLVVVLLLDLSTGLPGGVLTAVHWLGLAAVLAISWSRLPAERRSDALPLRSGWRWWAVAAVAGLLTFGVASLWVALANRGAPPEAVPEATDDMAWQVLLVAVLPSLVEEALCRGILWRALDRALRPLALMMATASDSAA